MIPVFIWSEAEEGPLAACGATKVWLEEALTVFKQICLPCMSSLVLRCADNSEKELLSIMKETGARDVVWTALYEPHLA